MSSQVKSIFKHSSVYSLGNILGKVVSFIMLPIYTHYLTPSDYGVIELLTLSVSLITMLISLRLTSALPRFYYGMEEGKRKTLVSTMLICSLALSALFAFVLFQGRFLISEIVFKTPDKGAYFGLVFVSMVFEIASQIAFTYLRVLERSGLFVLLSILQLFLGLSFNILFVVWFKYEIFGVLYSMVLSNGLIFLVLQAFAFSRVGFRIDRGMLRQILSYSLPLLPASAAVFVLNMGDRFLLSRFVDTAEIGVYSLGYKFGVLLGVFVGGPFLQAWEPKRVQLYEHDPDAKKIFSTMFVYVFTLLVFGALGISVFIREIVAVMAAPSYFRAGAITPFVVFGYVFYTIFYVLDVGIMVSKTTYWYSVCNLSAAAVNVGLNLILIPRYGIQGAAIATAASFMVLPVMGYFISQRYYPMRYEFGRALKVGLLGLAFYLGSLYLPPVRLPLAIAMKVALLAAFPVVLRYLGFFSEAEIDSARVFVRGLGPRIRAIFPKAG